MKQAGESGLSGRAHALEVQGPKFKPHTATRKKKTKTKKKKKTQNMARQPCWWPES
jgi:hypothetical protein